MPADRPSVQIAERIALATAQDTTATLLTFRGSPAATALPIVDLSRRAAAKLHAETDHLPDAGRRACAAGCSACCHMAVSVTAPEAIRVAEELRSQLAPGPLHDVRERLAAQSQRVSALTLEARAAARIPCALLGPTGACEIHPFRPLGCRGWTSFSRDACEAALIRGENGHSGELDQATFVAAAAAAEGLQAGARAADTDGGAYELHSACLQALQTPDAAARWARGEPIFAACARVRSERWRD